MDCSRGEKTFELVDGRGLYKSISVCFGFGFVDDFHIKGNNLLKVSAKTRRDLCLDKCGIYIYSRKVLLFLVGRRN
jgi:hypothetical protein